MNRGTSSWLLQNDTQSHNKDWPSDRISAGGIVTLLTDNGASRPTYLYGFAEIVLFMAMPTATRSVFG